MSEAEQTLFDKYTSEYGLNSEIANTLARDEALARFYEDALVTQTSYVSLANMVANEVARELKESSAQELRFNAAQVAELVGMIDEGTISNKIAKQVFEEMVQTGENPAHIVELKGLVQISDPAQLVPMIEEVIAKNPDNVAKFKAGNTKLLGFFVGQVLKATGGKANPSVVNELVEKALNV
jgi:glutaminyl-tRNA synthetase